MPELPTNALLVVDLSCWVYRFHATCGRFAAGHVHAFMEKVIRKARPSHVAIAGDHPGPCFRAELFDGYKGDREEKPRSLLRTLAVTKEMLEDINGLHTLEVEGYEADDIIASLAEWAAGNGLPSIILGLDKDLMQLVDERVVMWDGKDKVTGPAEVLAHPKVGVRPSQVSSFLALVGDKADCIPGVRGIGPVKARKLLAQGTIDQLKGAQFEQASQCLSLTRLCRDVPLHASLEGLRWRG